MDAPLAIDEARARILAAVSPVRPERVGLEDARGRVLAEAVRSDVAVPPFANSAMDGFAVGSAAGGQFAVAGESRAGAPFDGVLDAQSAAAISTGAAVPGGTAAVVPVEDAEASGGRVTVPATAEGAHVRHAGEDIERGDEVLRGGTTLGPAELGVLASIGRDHAMCAAAPNVALLATGDELTTPPEPLAPGHIYSSNTAVLRGAVETAGARTELAIDVPDTARATEEALARALGHADVVCVSGGVSVGEHDHVKGAFDRLGVEQVFWRVALRPGKPTWFGTAERDGRTVLCFGLPGNPVSAYVCFALFVRPALAAIQGADPNASRVPVRLTAPVQRMPGRTHCVRCRLAPGDGAWDATPTGPQGSHQLTSMVGAGALALVPPGEGEEPAGTELIAELLG